MVSERGMHVSHQKHRNVLYTLVVLLAIVQISSFIFLSIQVSKLSLQVDSELKQLGTDSKRYSDKLIEKYDSSYQQNFNEITKAVAKQQTTFEQEITNLKLTQSDFTAVVQDAVKSVVTVSNDKSLGTGFIVHPDGYIVTNYHVIQSNEKDISVLDFERKPHNATLVGKDEERDLALLKIDGKFVPIELQDSDKVEVGEKVIAIGNPLGLSFSVTEGIVSGLKRPGPNGHDEYVQTDVPLNPGNSGGPLIDKEGKIVGINNFKIGGAEALGFALESNSIASSVNTIAGRTLI